MSDVIEMISPDLDGALDLELLRSQFRQDGYVKIKGFLSADEMRIVYREVSRLLDEVVPRMPREDVKYEIKDCPGTLKQLHRLQDHDAFFAGLYYGGRFQRLAEVLVSETTLGHGFQYFSKPPGSSAATPAHQDGFYSMLTPCAAVTLWLALDEVDEENGCMRYVQGSHLRGMREHRTSGVLGFSQSMVDYGRIEDLANEVAIPASPGDLLVHHALTIHRADGNRSASRQRRSLGLGYYPTSCREDTVAKQAYQEKLRRELIEAGKI
jgi:phytanoyl-CoA hydroxylase